MLKACPAVPVGGDRGLSVDAANSYAMGEYKVQTSVLLPLARVGATRPLAAPPPGGTAAERATSVDNHGVRGGPPTRLRKTVGDPAVAQALGRALESLDTTATRHRHLMKLSIEYAFRSVYQASASMPDFVDALPLAVASGNHPPLFRWAAAATSCRGAAVSRRPDGKLSGCCQPPLAKLPRESAFTGDGLGGREFATAYARFMSTIQEEAPLPSSKDLPGPGEVLAFKTAAMTISVHVAQTAKRAVTCLAKVMIDDALQVVGLLPHPASTAQAQAQAATSAGRAQDCERRALRGRLTLFIADTRMGGAVEVKDGSWQVGAPPLV